MTANPHPKPPDTQEARLSRSLRPLQPAVGDNRHRQGSALGTQFLALYSDPPGCGRPGSIPSPAKKLMEKSPCRHASPVPGAARGVHLGPRWLSHTPHPLLTQELNCGPKGCGAHHVSRVTPVPQ